jgi:hypothetical protein
MAEAKYIKPKRQRLPKPSNPITVAKTAKELAA